MEWFCHRSYLQAVGGREDKPKAKEDLDLSKPYTPVLERSSQLMDDSILNESTRRVIDATPLSLQKKARKLKAKTEKVSRKRNIKEVDKENDHEEVSCVLGIYFLPSCTAKVWLGDYKCTCLNCVVFINFPYV